MDPNLCWIYYRTTMSQSMSVASIKTSTYRPLWFDKNPGDLDHQCVGWLDKRGLQWFREQLLSGGFLYFLQSRKDYSV